jgi:hypothetical protein
MFLLLMKSPILPHILYFTIFHVNMFFLQDKMSWLLEQSKVTHKYFFQISILFGSL